MPSARENVAWLAKKQHWAVWYFQLTFVDEVARAGREEGVKAGRQLAPGLLYIQDNKPKVIYWDHYCWEALLLISICKFRNLLTVLRIRDVYPGSRVKKIPDPDLFFVILKATDEKSRIRSRIRIRSWIGIRTRIKTRSWIRLRIHKSVVHPRIRIRTKYHGSTTLPGRMVYIVKLMLGNGRSIYWLWFRTCPDFRKFLCMDSWVGFDNMDLGRVLIINAGLGWILHWLDHWP